MRAVNTVSKHTHTHACTHTHTHACTHTHTHLSNRHSQWTSVQHLSGLVGEHLTGEVKLIRPHHLVVTHFLPGWVTGRKGGREGGEDGKGDIRIQRGDTHKVILDWLQHTDSLAWLLLAVATLTL